MALADLRDTLVERVRDQASTNVLYRNLVSGDGDLPALSSQARTEQFRRLLGWARVDLASVIVEATAERLTIDGFRTDPRSLDADDTAWALWTRERMPLDSQLAIIDALTVGDAFFVVERREDGTARIEVESSDTMTVEYAEGSRDEIVAAAKVWVDPADPLPQASGKPMYVTMYDADVIVRGVVIGGTWRELSTEENPLGFVPVSHLRNRPTLSSRFGRSELSGLENDLGRVNKASADLMLLSELSSFKVRYGTGIDVDTDDAGNAVKPYEIGPDRLLISENENARFGTLDESSLDPALNVVKAMVAQVAALSKTPMFYLSGDLVNLSGDALRAMDSQAVAKARQRQTEMSNAVAAAMRMALTIEGSPLADGPLEVMWADAEQRSFGEVANGVTQLVSAQVLPKEQAWIELGYGPLERERMRSYARQDALTSQVASRVAALRAQAAAGADAAVDENAAVPA